jgi:hypothetical protein
MHGWLSCFRIAGSRNIGIYFGDGLYVELSVLNEHLNHADKASKGSDS